MTTTAGFEEVIYSGELDAVVEWLAKASEDDLAAAKAWYAKGRARMRRWYHWRDGEVSTRLDTWELRRDLQWIEAGAALTLAGPISAAQWIPWGSLNPYVDSERKVGWLVERAVGRGRDWCTEFCSAAAEHRTDEHAVLTLYKLIRGVLDTFDLPAPDGASFANGWTSTLGYRLEFETLLARLRDDRLVPDVLHNVLAYGFITRLEAAGPAVTTALVAEGRMDRARLITQCFEMLTVRQPVGTQRFIAKLFAGLDVNAAEIPAGIALMQNLVATCDVSIGAWLLPFALDALSTEDDLLELTATIAGRTERKQKDTLLRALGSTWLRDRFGISSVGAALALLRDSASDDPRFFERIYRVAAKTGTTLDATPVSDDAPRQGLWDLEIPVSRYELLMLNQITGSDNILKNLAALAAGNRGPSLRPGWADVWTEMQLLGIVRLGAVGGADSTVDMLRQIKWMSDADLHDPYVHGEKYIWNPVLEGIHDGICDPSSEGYLRALDLAGVRRFDPERRHWLPPVSLNLYATAFRYLLARETFARLGRVRGLLSAPQLTDGSITFAELVTRVEFLQGETYGPFDLYQALLRLRLTAEDDVEALNGMTLAPDLLVAPPAATTLPDGVSAIREWVGASGLPAPTVDVFGYAGRRTSEPPLPPERFGVPMADVDTRGSDDPLRNWTIVPEWYELSLTSGSTAGIRHRAYPAGDISHRVMIARLTESKATAREDGARLVLELIGEGRFDPAIFSTCLVNGFSSGGLPLARTMDALDLLATAGALRLVWPAVHSLADAVAAARPLPPGGADVISWLLRYINEVPLPTVPPSVQVLAQDRGGTKSHHAARALVAAAERAAAR